MKKEEYLKPEMIVIQLKSNTQLLTGSTMEINEDEIDNVNSIL